MAKDREQILGRIYQILSYIKNDELISLLQSSGNNFNDNELELILKYLESGELSFLSNILNKKIQKYKLIIQDIKMKKIKEKLNENKNKEKIEKEIEENSLNQIL